MDALQITEQGTPVASHIAFVTGLEQPSPAAGELLIRTEASALNHLDLWVGRGLPGLDSVFPLVSGSDGCGIVEAVGEGVDPQWMGERVVLNAALEQMDALLPHQQPALPAITMIGEHLSGTHASCFLAPATNVVAVGDTDPVDAAAFGLTHLTAWSMLKKASISMGQTVLITGIGGGVALAALNLCQYLGCRCIVTSRSTEKCQRAKALGAQWTICDEGQDFSKQVRKITGGSGVDVCVDSIGKHTHLPCIKSLARGGAYVTCGCTTGPDAVTDLARIFWNRLRIIGSTMGTMAEFREVTALLTSGKIKPVVDRIIPAAEGEQAYAYLESGDQFGKVVLRWGC